MRLAEIAAGSLPVAPMFTASHVYGLVSDEDGVEYLVAYRIVRAP
jgi:hypothetical protein